MDVATQVQGLGELQNDNVIVHGVLVPRSRIAEQSFGNGDVLTAVPIGFASHDVDVVHVLVGEAMGGAEHGFGIQDGTSAKVTTSIG